jgi:hypothetical protein
MATVTITLNIKDSSDDSVNHIAFVEMLNKIKEDVRMKNYSLENYKTFTSEVMHDNCRGIITIIT